MSDSGIIKIHGREYKTVALRVAEFREKHPIHEGWGILTELVTATDEVVVVRASVTHNSNVIGTGYAEEVRASSNINRTSAVENCETSAVGRALAACGFAGSEYASANEVQGAIKEQDALAETQAALEEALPRCNDAIVLIKEGIECGDLATAAGAWFELSDEDKRALWVAPSKFSDAPFTTDERRVIKSSEFRRAHYGDAA